MQSQLKTRAQAVTPPPEPAAHQELAGAFRAAMRRMAATVTIVSARHRGVSYGMTATAVTSVSVEPPSLLVCVNHDASIHAPLWESGRFCISLLGIGHDEYCHTFSGRECGESRFESGNWRDEDGIPYLADAQANLFCTVAKRIRYGTHTVFIGHVTHVRVDDQPSPLVYVNGALAHELVQGS